MLTRAYVKFGLDGNIVVEAPVDVTITAAGNATINAANVTINAETAVVNCDDLSLGATGGPAVARVGDSVADGVITSGSSKVTAA